MEKKKIVKKVDEKKNTATKKPAAKTERRNQDPGSFSFV